MHPAEAAVQLLDNDATSMLVPEVVAQLWVAAQHGIVDGSRDYRTWRGKPIAPQCELVCRCRDVLIPGLANGRRGSGGVYPGPKGRRSPQYASDRLGTVEIGSVGAPQVDHGQVDALSPK
jgi:hypothetical protein